MQELNRWEMALLSGVALCSVLPALIGGLPFFSHDATAHTIWYTQFSSQFWAGEWYPRWLSNMNLGLGSPTFFYYPPAAHFLTLPLSIFPLDSWYQLGISTSIAQLLSGVTAYVWLRQITHKRAAAIAAVLYIWMPYHLGFDFYRRAAIAEIWTFVWMPLCLHVAARVVRERTSLNALGLSACYGLLVMTHLPTTLIFTPLLACYMVYLWWEKREISALLSLGGSLILGIGLAAIYLLPAMLMQDYTRLGQIHTGPWHFENWFLVTHLRPWGSQGSYFWMVLISTALGLCCVTICRHSSAQKARRQMRFWLVTMLACVFMMTPLSKSIWIVFPSLQKIQFPWRFNVLICVALAALIALAIPCLQRPFFARSRNLKVFALVLVFTWLPYAAVQAGRAYPLTRPMPKDVGDIERRLKQNRDQPEYRTAWTQRQLETEEDLLALADQVGRSPDGSIIPYRLVSGNGSVAIAEQRPREIHLKVSAESDMSFTMSHFYLPLWTARTAAGQQLTVTPSDDLGFISVSVPAGEHEIALRLEQHTMEKWGAVISAVSLGLLVILGMIVLLKNRLLR